MALRSLQIMVGTQEPVTSADCAVTRSRRRNEKAGGGGLWPIRVLAVAGLGLLLFLLPGAAAKGITIHVPADQPTIQAAINTATDGDTVLVAPGTYKENIDFKGKAITVKSVNGAATTIIDGGGLDSVVRFATNEGASSILDGFTIQNGLGGFNSGYQGSGIVVNNSSPTITNNTITGNVGCDGLGIAISFGSPVVQGNTITKNTRTSCSGGNGGGGILIIGAASAQILNNTISNNVAGNGVGGGGISMFSAGTPTIRGNFIMGNSVSTSGGGIGMVNSSNALIIENVITGNTAPQGGGIAPLVPSGETGPTIVNNTIVGNSGVNGGSEIYLNGFYGQTQFFNNIIIGTAGQSAVFCDSLYSNQPPIFKFNDTFNPLGTAYGGICTSETGQNGNISADPLFVNSAASDFHLKAGSPVIDAGSNAAPNLPARDIAGNDRILNGDGDCIATIDMGAYEFARPSVLTFSSVSLVFPDQAVGITSAPQPVTVTNTGSATATVCGVTSSGDFAQTNTCSSIAVGTNCQINMTFTPTVRGIRTGLVQVITSDAGSPQDITLSGKGVAPAVSLSTNVVNFSASLVDVKSTSQTVTVSNTGDVALAITSVIISGDFAETNTCGSSVAMGQNCSIDVTFTPTASGTRSGLITINDNVIGTPQTVNLSGTGLDFSMAAAAGGSTTATIVAGQTGIFNLQVAPSGFVGTVNLGCSGAPPESTCTISPVSVSLNGNTAQGFSVGVATTARSMIFPRIQLPRPIGKKPFSIFTLLWLLMALLLILGRSAAPKDGRGRLAIPAAAMLLLGILLGGCNTANTTIVHGTPANTYTITVTGTDAASGANRTLSLTLVVK
jgi:hypothetical protein